MIKIIPLFVDQYFSHPIPLWSDLFTSFIILYISLYLFFLYWKITWLPSTQKHWHGRYHLMWLTHNANMHHPMHSPGSKIPYIRKQVHQTEKFIHLVIFFYLSSTSNPTPQTNLVHYIISKYLQYLLNLIMLKPSQYMSTIKVLYRNWNHNILQSLFPMRNIFKYRYNCHMGRNVCELRFPLSLISYIHHW